MKRVLDFEAALNSDMDRAYEETKQPHYEPPAHPEVYSITYLNTYTLERQTFTATGFPEGRALAEAYWPHHIDHINMESWEGIA